MYEFMINNYFENLDKNKITYLALKNNIHLSDNELDYLYLTLKKEYKTLLSDVNLQKLLNLYLIYRKMYEGFFIKKSDY